MRLLALDTSTPLSGVAVYESETDTATVRRERVTAHSDTLLLHIASCLEQRGLVPRDLVGVVCGRGPGPGLLLSGDGAHKYAELRGPARRLLPDPYPDPLVLARLGVARLLRGQPDPLAPAVPHYVAPAAAAVGKGEG